MPPDIAIDVAQSSRKRSRSRLYAIVAVATVVALVAGLLLREPVERAFATWAVRTLTGGDVAIGSVDHAGPATVLNDVHVVSDGGAVTLAVPRADVTFDGRDLGIALHAPRLTVAAHAWSGREPERVVDGASRLHLADDRFAVSVEDGVATLVLDPGATAALTGDRIAGTVRVDRGRITYDVALNVDDGATAYPVSGHAAADATGTIAQTWSAAALPLAPLSALLPPEAGLAFARGALRDVTFAGGETATASARFDAVAGTLAGRGAQHHSFHGLSGAIAYGPGALGTSGMHGLFDAVPIDIVGEVHDLGDGFGWLAGGSNDLRRLARLAVAASEEPAVQSIHVETTAPGLAFAQYAMTTDHGPLAVQVLSADPHEPTLRFDTAIANDHVVSGGERTSAMGVRTNAVAGVNGDYFDIGRTYQPQGMLMREGRLLRGPTDRAALVVGRDNAITFGEFHLIGTLQAGGKAFPVTQLNDWPAGNVTVVTDDFGKTLPPAAGVTFAPLVALGGDRFRVADVLTADAPLPVRFGIAFGSGAAATLHRGEVVRLDYRLDPNVRDAVAAIGGGPILLRDGEWYDDPHAPAPDERDVRWPVIALGRQRNDDLLLVAVDGRHPERSVGMTRPDFGELLRRFDVVDAMALDSGGSVTMVSRAPGDKTATVRNVPSDQSQERWVSDALFLYSSAPLPSLVPPKAAPTPIPEVRPSP